MRPKKNRSNISLGRTLLFGLLVIHAFSCSTSTSKSNDLAEWKDSEYENRYATLYFNHGITKRSLLRYLTYPYGVGEFQNSNYREFQDIVNARIKNEVYYTKRCFNDLLCFTITKSPTFDLRTNPVIIFKAENGTSAPITFDTIDIHFHLTEFYKFNSSISYTDFEDSKVPANGSKELRLPLSQDLLDTVWTTTTGDEIPLKFDDYLMELGDVAF